MIYDQLLDRFLAWAETQPDIVGAIVVGSQARTDPPPDKWSDLDLVIITTQVERYIAHTDWLAALGPYWLTFIENQGVGEGSERRVLFEGGVDVDFVPTPYAEIQQIITNGWPPDWASVLQRGYRLVLDKQGLADRLPPVESTGLLRSKPPTEGEFTNLCNDFLYHVVWTAKKLRRGELWVAKSCLDMYMKHLLLQMTEWHTLAKQGEETDTWHRGRFLEEWADSRVVDGLGQAFAHYDAEDIERALLTTAELFRWLAQETAEQFGYLYPNQGDEEVTQWLIDCLEGNADG
jgi:aminoglycoside 6-adenylyltransferase